MTTTVGLENRLAIAEIKIRMLELAVHNLSSKLLDVRDKLYNGYDGEAWKILDEYLQAQEKDEEQE